MFVPTLQLTLPSIGVKDIQGNRGSRSHFGAVHDSDTRKAPRVMLAGVVCHSGTRDPVQGLLE